MQMKSKIIITGSAGFVGFHLSKYLCENGFEVLGIDNLNEYYDVKLKIDRLEILNKLENFEFIKLDLVDKNKLNETWKKYNPQVVINLAAQAGVRYSIENPYAYIDSNIIGFLNVLEACRAYPVNHMIYASSSSVYGANSKIPFAESDNVDHPVSLYAATKKSNELMAHTYSNLYDIPTTGLRFFTVYGPWGRPDMAYYSFTKNILEDKPINVFNHGNLKRDFTFIDDIVAGIVKLIDQSPEPNAEWDREKSNPSDSFAPYKIFNIGNNKPVKLMDFINVLENCLNKKAKINFLDMQQGDVNTTYADITLLNKLVDFEPKTSIDEGLARFVMWYKNYYTL